MKEIYIAGGCFWGVEKYYNSLKGVIETKCGYANGNTENPKYEDLKKHLATHSETVYIKYDESIISIEKILEHFLRFVDPYSINKQAEDEGLQYRSGVYYLNEQDKEKILNYFKKHLNENYKIEVLPLNNFYEAEEYHQKYLDKNIHGYCHINLNLIKDNEKK